MNVSDERAAVVGGDSDLFNCLRVETTQVAADAP